MANSPACNIRYYARSSINIVVTVATTPAAKETNRNLKKGMFNKTGNVRVTVRFRRVRETTFAVEKQ